MKMSEEMAVRLHRMMWSDMQKELGDRPSGNDRLKFKREWVERNFPGEHIPNNCWLCEYASSVMKPGDHEAYCKYCPISWPFLHCNTLDFSYAKAPISEILALPAKNKELVTRYVANDGKAGRDYPYARIKKVLSEASGVPDYVCAEDHIKAIQEKAVQQSNLSKIYGDTKMELAKASGLKAADTTTDHIKEIKEKAVEEYFAKTPGAKLATMDVDQAFKQYADESKAPIFRALAEASGLSAGNESVKAHISLIRDTAKQNGRLERSEEFFKALSVYSGVSKDDWRLQDHVEAIQIKERENLQPLRKANGHMSSLITKYKDRLSDTSGLDRNRPVDDHVRAIFNNGFEAGKESARDLLLNKIEEILGQ